MGNQHGDHGGTPTPRHQEDHRVAKSEHNPNAPRSARPPRPRGALGRARTAVAVAAARTTGASLRRLRLGGGTSLPGLIAGGLDPRIVAHLSAQLRHGSVVVTGTNGKTTTSGLLAYILKDAGLRVWRNREGANLLRGVTAALVIRSELNGMLRGGGDAAAVFEVDEAAFPRVIAELRPRTILVTNLFRDQLDRYGEVDTVAERWRAALAATPASTTLALNADDPAIAALASAATRTVVYFGVEDAPAAIPGEDRVTSGEVIDTRTCPRCRAPLTYSIRFYSHIGHWACPNCGYARPIPTIRARAVTASGLDSTQFRLETPTGAADVTLALPGLYNVYNALAAAAAAHLMDAHLDAMRTAIQRFTPAFGRAEHINADGRFVRILLAKNPTGLNEVLRALAIGETPGTSAPRRHLLLLLNDRAADGEDVSWIWDADYERVPAIARTIVVSGTRAADLALRLKYAGVTGDDLTVEPDVARALDTALANIPEGDTLYVVPTYTAMLAVRGELERRGYAPHYWETADA